MCDKLTRLTIKNFRSLANLTIDLSDINVLFGSNGSGKSTFLDTIWFIRDCAINGVESASKSFPCFDDIILEQTGPTTIYGSFLDKRLRQPIFGSGVSDGHLQMLLHLTALFSDGTNRDSLILFDEPEISLHPWAIAVFAKAVKLAAETWNKQIFIATHSPVLMSQFDPEHILETSVDATGQTVIRRLNEISEIQDLLKDYAVGSLYMAELIAPQSQTY